MTSRSEIEKTLQSLYKARVQGDLEGTMKDIADDGSFGIYARGTGVAAMSSPIKGKLAVKQAVKELIDNWIFKDWTQMSLLVEGEKAVLHWRAHVTFKPTNKSDTFDVFDHVTFRDGKIVDFRQSTDTAMMMKVAS